MSLAGINYLDSRIFQGFEDLVQKLRIFRGILQKFRDLGEAEVTLAPSHLQQEFYRRINFPHSVASKRHWGAEGTASCSVPNKF